MLDSPMRDRMAAFTMQGEDLPQATNRIDLDPTVRDVWGLPAGRVTYRRTATRSPCASTAPRLEAVIRDAGASGDHDDIAAGERRGRRERMVSTPASYHIMGTCRMGTDPTARWSGPRAGCGTSTTCWWRTRRSSPPRPGTTPHSHSCRWPTASPASSSAHHCLPPSPTRDEARTETGRETREIATQNAGFGDYRA